MRVVTEREFQDNTSTLIRSDDILLVTRDGEPSAMYVPISVTDLPLDLRKRMFARIAGEVHDELEAAGVSEEEVLADFAATRRGRRRR